MTYLDVGTPSTDPGPDKGRRKEKTPGTRVNRYWKEIEAYNKASSDWREQGNKIVKLYLDQHRTSASPRRFAMLWANVEVTKPAVYAKIPTMLCSRRYKDPAPIGRVAAELLERATNTTLDLYHVDEVFRLVRDDRLLAGRGQAWVRYEAAFDRPEGKGNGYDSTGAQDYDKVVGEKACVDYVGWQDFGHNVAGTWADVWLVWRIVHKTYAEVEERWDTKTAEKLTFSAQVDSDGQEGAGEHTARIYELWDKRKKQTVWMAREVPDFLEPPDAPPLNFRNFFPCPEPCLATRTGKSLIPTPDYRYYQDQANEIDDLTDKIANMTEFLAVRAFVPAGPSSEGADAVRMMIQSLQSQMTNNKSVFIPVESWAGFTERGGAGKLIEWLDINNVAQALQTTILTRKQMIEDVYEITGLSDILRGQTDPSETLGAQQIKSQTGSRRIKNCKDAVANFCKDIGQLVAEVVAEQFQPQTIADITGYQYTPGMGPVTDPAQAQQGVLPPQMPAGPSPLLGPQASPGAMPPPASQQQPLAPGMSSPQPPAPPPQSAPPLVFDDRVMELLRNDRMRGFVIDIETDSTIQPDEDAEKQRRTEFITAVGSFLQQAAPMIQQAPPLAPMASEMLLFLTRGFRAGRSLEEVIERTMQQVQTQMTQQAANPPPDPKVEAEKAKMEMDGQRMAAEMQAEQQKMQAELQFKQAEMQQKLELEQQKMQLEREKLELEKEQAIVEMQLKQAEAQQKMQLEVQKMELDRELQQKEFEMKSVMQEQEMAAKQAAAEQEQQLARDGALQKIEQEGVMFNDDRKRKHIQFDDEQKRANEAHTKDMSRKDAMAMHESTTRANTERDITKANAGKPRKKIMRGRYGDKQFEAEIEE